jgi:hypothetical protein
VDGRQQGWRREQQQHRPEQGELNEYIKKQLPIATEPEPLDALTLLQFGAEF